MSKKEDKARKKAQRHKSASFAPSMHAPVIIDIAGTVLNEDDRRRLNHPLTGGLILFSRNWQNREQLTSLCASIKKLRSDLLICVDHEGGRVQRFRTDGFTHLPSMRHFATQWMNDDNLGKGSGAMRAMESASACGYVLSSELRSCGVDLSFTPVLDLDWGPSSVIGDRAFHRDPRVTTMLARCVMQGLLQAGMANCGKHFPGHGFVAADSHIAVPVDERSLQAILADDAKPYEWLSTVLTSVMPAHVIYSKVDSQPAGFSKQWLQNILREQLQFTGAIFSDDLSMEGASVAGSHEQGAIAAINAGCDMVLLCNQSIDRGGVAIDELLDGLYLAKERGEWQLSQASEARRLSLLPHTPPLVWDDLMRHLPYMQALEKLGF